MRESWSGGVRRSVLDLLVGGGGGGGYMYVLRVRWQGGRDGGRGSGLWDGNGKVR